MAIMSNCRIVLTTLILILTLYNTATSACVDETDTYKVIGKNIYAGTLPEIELLAGIQTQTSWMNKRGPKGKGNYYYHELRDFFSKYKNHEAVKIAEELSNTGFNYDAPINFILQLSPLPDLNRPEIYSEYLKGRAGGEENLERFRVALKQLAEESKFLEFYDQHSKKYEEWTCKALAGLNADTISNWMASYFGWSGDEFHLVFAPAMFPQGGYGASKHVGDTTIIYQIIRENNKSDSMTEFITGLNLMALSFHEFGHAFVNPSVEKCSMLIKKYRIEELYAPIETDMEKQAYGTATVFINEIIDRAITARAFWYMKHDRTIYDKIIANEERNGFYFISFVCKQLEYYEKNRAKYRRFDEFIPYLLKQLKSNKKTLLKLI